MNTFALLLLLILHADPVVPHTSKKDRPTRLAHYQTGIYLTSLGTKLRVNVDKQLGGWVSIQLTDQLGRVYFEQTLKPTETVARLSLDITDLNDGEYSLKLSNGLEVEMRTIRITTPEPTTTQRSITVQ